MEQLILNYINNPRSAEINFKLAEAYEKINHYAGASTHFLRCAEYGDLKEDADLIYESLIHIALLLGKLRDRTFTEEGWLLHAINFQPDRPEAYWCLSLVYERQKKWYEAYTMANIAIGKQEKPLNIDIEFVPYKLLFQKAVAAWWIGRVSESREIFFSLPDYPLDEKYIELVQRNLNNIGGGEDPFVHFDKKKLPQIRYKFKGYETIEQTYGQSYQDLFVLTMLDGKRNGYYLEIGSADPYLGSNTALLEKQFGWKGISIEMKEDLVKKFKQHRANEVVCKDATIINYDKLLRQSVAPLDIDYLQLDCEPPKVTYDILKAIPFERYRFAVITFEHDHYADVRRLYRQKSRELLSSYGYVLVVNDIGRDSKCSFEDWWVHPDLISSEILKKMKDINPRVHLPEEYMFPPLKKEKLEGFPAINWISLRSSTDRQSSLEEQIKKYQLLDYPNEAFDGREVDYMNHPNVKIQHFSNTSKILDSGGVATAMSHLMAIKNWLERSDPHTESYALFVEDDVFLEIVEYWNFTWKEFYDRLPEGWKAIQLSLIRETPLTNEDMKLSVRKWNNWSAQAYLLTREYAQKIVDEHIEGENFNLIEPYNVIPISENVIFGAQQEGIYTIPLFTENNSKFKSSFFPAIIKEEHKAYQVECSRFIIDWWKSNSSNQLKWIFNS